MNKKHIDLWFLFLYTNNRLKYTKSKHFFNEIRRFSMKKALSVLSLIAILPFLLIRAYSSILVFLIIACSPSPSSVWQTGYCKWVSSARCCGPLGLQPREYDTHRCQGRGCRNNGAASLVWWYQNTDWKSDWFWTLPFCQTVGSQRDTDSQSYGP